MIAPDKRKALFLLHQQGMSIRQIARRLGVSRRTVRQAIAREGQPPGRGFVPPLDAELVRGLYEQCDGYPLAPNGVRNQQIDPPHKPAARAHPRPRPQPSDEEEKRLRAFAPALNG